MSDESDELLSKLDIIYLDLITYNQHSLCFQGYFSEPRAMFLCNEGAGHTGQFVYIKDEREEQEYLGLCEVQVFPVQSKFNVISFRNDL